MLSQRTLKRQVKVEGIGLHTGSPSTVVICPAPPDTGIVFISGGTAIKAISENVGDTSYATTLHSGGSTVRTVEHLLAALSGLSVDNAFIEVDGPEVPIMDGSSGPFVKALKEAGIKEQKAPRRYIKILKAITVNEGDKSATLLPSPVPRMTYRIDFEHPLISDQSLSMDLSPADYEQDLADARTFGFLRDVQMLWKAGLAKGGSPENAVVVDEDRILNDEGLRFPDEFVRHKMLDAIGDLSLLGMPFIGHLVADKSGHRLNQRLVEEVLSHPDAWIAIEGEPALEETPATLVEAQVSN